MGLLKKLVIAVISVLTVAAGVIYGGGCWYFQSHFLPKTEISGFDVSCYTVEETEQLLELQILSYVLAVETRNGGREKLSAKQAGMSYQCTGEVKNRMEEQPYYQWFLVMPHSYTLSNGFRLDQEKLDQAVHALKCAQNMQAPVDARILKSDGKYQVIPEIYGTQLDLEKAKELIETALKRRDDRVSLETCYKNPSILKEDVELNNACDALNRMQQVIITYDFGDRSEYIDGSVLEQWGAGYPLKRSLVKKYVEKLAEKYDTCGNRRKFITYDNREIEISGGTYGWKIDVEKETDVLYELILTGTVTVRQPVYSHTALKRERNDIGFSYLEIDTTAAKIVLYIDGTPVLEDRIVLFQNLPVGCNVLEAKRKAESHRKFCLQASQDIQLYGLAPDKEASLKIGLSDGSILSGGEPACILSESSASFLYQTIPDGCPIIIY